MWPPINITITITGSVYFLIYFLFAEATGAISQGYAFCKYVVQPL